MGTFPCPNRASNSRRSMLERSAKRGQPSLTAPGGSELVPGLKLNDVDDERLYIPTARSETSFAIPQPKDRLDWLVQVPEEGQTFDDYLNLLTTRTTGRMKPLANAEGMDVLLLPIVRRDDDGDKDGEISQWPSSGPSRDQLVEYTKVFFDRQVKVLPAATLKVMNAHRTSNAKSTSRKNQRNNSTSISKVGAFAAASKCRFKLSLPGKSGKGGSIQTQVDVAGRMDISSDRIQLQVMSLLDELSAYRYNRHSTMTSKESKDFCIMGITMEDLFDGPSDLFCAGMAFGGDKVAIFSFHRYHPLLKMHPLHWNCYGYTDKCDGYSYYEDDDQDPTGLSHRPPLSSNPESAADKKKMNSEFLRRSCKLLTHA